MSYHPYRFRSIEDEEHLLTEIVQLQDKIRRNKENNHQLKSAEEKHYNKVFKPITTSISDLKRSSDADDRSATSVDDNDDGGESEGEQMSDGEDKIKIEPGKLYSTALRSISGRSLDDGVLGLNAKTKRIGDYTYRVDGDTLRVFNSKGEVRSKTITNYDLWRLLLSQTTKGIPLTNKHGRNTAAANEYIALADDLGLLDSALQLRLQGLKTRKKYKLLTTGDGAAVGRGFLFTSKRPGFLMKNNSRKQRRLVHPSVVVVPSNKKKLLRELLKGVAELRSGNTSMRNVVVPLAQEAKRLKILPPGLLTDREMAWVYA